MGTVHEGWRWVATEGYLMDPDGPPPPAAAALWSWRTPNTRHTIATTSSDWAHWEGDGGSRGDYVEPHLEGYVFDPGQPAPADTVAVYRWYSPSRDDHWTTTRHPDEGSRGEDLLPDYTFVRLEGFVHEAFGP
ncbi:MAG: hypothetical protein AAF602_26535 [Myxococcota bacterium]